MLSYFGCVLPALRSHDKRTVEEGENETEILHHDIILVRNLYYYSCSRSALLIIMLLLVCNLSLRARVVY